MLTAGCSRQPSINGEFRIDYVWADGKVNSASVEALKPKGQVSQRSRERILKEAQPFIASTVNSANLNHATGAVWLRIYGPKPYFVQMQQLTIAEPDFGDLKVAVEQEDSGSIRRLVSTFHNVNQRELPSRQTALAIAAAGGHVKSIQTLLELGADPNLSDYIGITPLMAAVTAGSEDSVTVLLQAGANASVVNATGDSAASLAKKLHRDKILTLLTARQG